MKHLPLVLLLSSTLVGRVNTTKQTAYLTEAYSQNTRAYTKCLDAVPNGIHYNEGAAVCDRRWQERQAELATLGRSIEQVGQIPTVFTPPRYIQ